MGTMEMELFDQTAGTGAYVTLMCVRLHEKDGNLSTAIIAQGLAQSLPPILPMSDDEQSVRSFNSTSSTGSMGRSISIKKLNPKNLRRRLSRRFVSNRTKAQREGSLLYLKGGWLQRRYRENKCGSQNSRAFSFCFFWIMIPEQSLIVI